MRLKKDIKIKLINQKIRKVKTFQLTLLNQKDLQKSLQVKRLSKFQLANLDFFIFSKKDLKFPIGLNFDKKDTKKNLIYSKQGSFHFKGFSNCSGFKDSISNFQKLSSLLTNYSYLRLLSK